MTIASKFIRDFDAIARAGGAEDFELRLSSLEVLSPRAAQFKITSRAAKAAQIQQGSVVVLDWSEPLGTFRVRCSCVAFQRHGELCHHIWSAILDFDQSNQIEIVESRRDIEARPVSLKRLTDEEAAAALIGGVDPNRASQWPIRKIKPSAFFDFKHIPSTGRFTLTALGFEYGSFRVQDSSPRKEFLDPVGEFRIKRNISAEKELLKEFKGELTPKRLSGMKFEPQQLKDFIVERQSPDLRYSIDGKRVVSLEMTHSHLGKSEDYYDFSASFTAANETFTLSTLLGSPADRLSQTSLTGLIQMRDGAYAILEEDWAKRLDILSRGAVLSKEGTLRFSRASLPLFRAAFEGAKELEISDEAKSVFATLTALGISGKAEIPKHLKASLRSYQAEGLSWLLKMSDSRFGGILADDMGLGKTVQIIAYFLSRRAHFQTHATRQKPSLVVVPKSLVSNWKNEIEKFGPALRVLDFAGPNRVIFRPQHFDIVLTTYHVLKNEIERLKLTDFDSIILDEAQAIKNPSSQISKAVFQLNGRQKFALSGTPIENSLRDLFSLLHFTNPGLVPASFDRIYGERKSLDLPKAVTDRIAASVRPFILRRTKKQVLTELPDKSEQTLYCDMETAQKSLYDKTRKHFKLKLSESSQETQTGPKATRVFEALLRLRQISCHPALLGESGKGIESTKVEMLLEHLEDIKASGNKALVFSQFTSFLDLLKPELSKAGITFEHLDGQTRNRGQVVDRFNSDPKTTVFLISLKAGGTGLNLTTASYVFLMDPWWNPAIESQAIDRAYRMGQKQKVMAYRLIATGTIEEKIMKLQDQKRSLASALISEDETLASSLSLDDLEFLLDE